MKNLVSTFYSVMAIAVCAVEVVTSTSTLSAIGYGVLGLFFWPIFIAIWLSRLAVPFLRAHGLI